MLLGQPQRLAQGNQRRRVRLHDQLVPVCVRLHVCVRMCVYVACDSGHCTQKQDHGESGQSRCAWNEDRATRINAVDKPWE
eukprot:14291577-Alexandrium_andersonii.AAC.1